jgi:hypothetical protein
VSAGHAEAADWAERLLDTLVPQRA